MLCTGTNRTLALPVAPLTEPRRLSREPMPSPARMRGLITVTDAPVSSMSWTDPLPLTLAVTMMGLPGVKGMRVALLSWGDPVEALGIVGAALIIRPAVHLRPGRAPPAKKRRGEGEEQAGSSDQPHGRSI